jgi:hypothetical protein
MPVSLSCFMFMRAIITRLLSSFPPFFTLQQTDRGLHRTLIAFDREHLTTRDYIELEGLLNTYKMVYSMSPSDVRGLVMFDVYLTHFSAFSFRRTVLNDTYQPEPVIRAIRVTLIASGPAEYSIRDNNQLLGLFLL